MRADEIEGGFAPRVRPELASVELDGETVVYDETEGGMHVLNPTATVVWSCLDGSVTVQDLGAELAEAYGADVATVGDQVLELVRQLGRQGLLDGVEPDPDAVGPDDADTDLPAAAADDCATPDDDEGHPDRPAQPPQPDRPAQPPQADR